MMCTAMLVVVVDVDVLDEVFIDLLVNFAAVYVVLKRVINH